MYGPSYSPNLQREEKDVVLSREQEISRKLGIDMYELFELRQHLVEEMGSVIERKANTL